MIEPFDDQGLFMPLLGGTEISFKAHRGSILPCDRPFRPQFCKKELLIILLVKSPAYPADAAFDRISRTCLGNFAPQGTLVLVP